jgi:hypothetical protein
MILLRLAAGVDPVKIKCSDIGVCSPNTATLDVGFANIFNTLIGVVGGLAFIFIIVSGLQMVLSNGNAKRYQQARESLTYSIVGVALSIVAWGIVNLVVTSLK